MFGKKEDAKTTGSLDKLDTIFGNSCSVNGDIISKGAIKIDGKVNGNVTSEAIVIIATNGSITGDVKCKELVVFGMVEGTITTDNLQLKNSSRINGEINTKSLQVEPGAVYQGAVNMQKAAVPATPAAAKKEIKL